MAFAAIKIGRRHGGSSRTGTWRERICSDTQFRRRGTAGLFSAQPIGPRPVGCFFRVAHSSRINFRYARR
jgi:hypothetical protein